MKFFFQFIFYKVLLDGQNIKEVNVTDLRSHIGVVSQEPTLFSTTIAENIAFGHEGVTQLEIEKAAKIANSHDFITRFPKVEFTFMFDMNTNAKIFVQRSVSAKLRKTA